MRSSVRSPRAASLVLLALAGPVVATACSGPTTSAEPVKEPAAPPSAAPPPPPATPQGATPGTSSSPAASAAPVASAAPAALPPTEEKKTACPKGMALIRGGKMLTGAPKREVTVGAVCLDVNEATAEEYTACLKSGKCSDTQLKCAPQATYGTDGKANHPINCVDFSQAVAYCKAQNKRLPTTEEWEFAARGSAARIYPWGNDAPSEQVCWSGKDVHTGTCPVGATPKGDSPEGVHDLAGNVFEWTTSKNDAKTDVRDGRGGSWKDGTPELLRSGRPGGFKITYRCGFLGIRCAVDAPSGAEGK